MRKVQERYLSLRTVIGVGFAICGSACDPATENDAQNVQTDTVSISTRPIWAVGGEDAASSRELLHMVTGAKRLRNGSVVVAVSGMVQLRRYSADGNLLWVNGQGGQGPGNSWRWNSCEVARTTVRLVFTIVDKHGLPSSTLPGTYSTVGRCRRIAESRLSSCVRPAEGWSFILRARFQLRKASFGGECRCCGRRRMPHRRSFELKCRARSEC